MPYLLEQIGGVVIGGIIILMLLGFNQLMKSSSDEKFAYSILQQEAVSTIDIIENDFYMIGYRCAGDKIVAADSTRLKFRTDLIDASNPEGDGAEDILDFYLGSTSELNLTTNTNDMALYRKANNEAEKYIGIVTDFKFTYDDKFGTKLAYLDLESETGRKNIKKIGVYLRLESPEKFNGYYQKFETNTVINPKNLNL